MNESAQIFLIEDDPDDSFLLKRALRKNGVSNQIEVIDRMADAVCRLRAHNPAVPLFLIINLGMFLSEGAAIMRWVRQQEAFSAIPIVAIGNSDREVDIQSAYDLGANAYFAKRLSADELAQLIRELQFFNSSSV